MLGVGVGWGVCRLWGKLSVSGDVSNQDGVAREGGRLECIVIRGKE